MTGSIKSTMADAHAMHADALELAEFFSLAPHPEGGFFRETYRSPGLIPKAALPEGFSGDRAYSTAIAFLLPEGQKSVWHRIRQDEVWHFYLGGPLRLVMISPEGLFSEVTMGPEFRQGQLFQFVVPAGSWFGAAPLPGSGFSLVGCTVAPGFNFADFELADQDALVARYPQHAGSIIEFF